jgi:hypothetical protein
VSLVEQELLTLMKHLSSPLVYSGVRVTRSLVLYVCFVDRCLFFCTFSFGHCVVCPSSIYGFWLPLWYFQTLLKQIQPDWFVIAKSCKKKLFAHFNVIILASGYTHNWLYIFIINGVNNLLFICKLYHIFAMKNVQIIFFCMILQLQINPAVFV